MIRIVASKFSSAIRWEDRSNLSLQPMMFVDFLPNPFGLWADMADE